MTLSLTSQQTRLLRLKAQRLDQSPQGNPAPISPAQVISDIFALQAQSLPAALLSVRARSKGLTADLINQARQNGAIVWTWCMRGTLHLIPAEDASWLIPLLGSDAIAANRSRFRQLGWDETNATAAIRMLQQSIANQGGLTRSEITQLLQVNGFPHAGQATIHLLYYAALQCIICSGPDRGDKPTYVLFENWLGKPQSLPRQAAVEKLALRYLESYAPATPHDLSRWSGLKLNEIRSVWETISPHLVEVDAAGEPAWMPESHLAWLEQTDHPSPVVRLLPRFDTFLMGYASRKLMVEDAFLCHVFPGNGWINPVLLVDGFIQGIWKTNRRGGIFQIMLQPFRDLEEELLPLLEAEVSDLGRFLEEETALTIEKPKYILPDWMNVS